MILCSLPWLRPIFPQCSSSDSHSRDDLSLCLLRSVMPLPFRAQICAAKPQPVLLGAEAVACFLLWLLVLRPFSAGVWLHFLIYFCVLCGYMCVHIWEYVCACVICNTHACTITWGQQRASDPLELSWRLWSRRSWAGGCEALSFSFFLFPWFCWVLFWAFYFLNLVS